ncbi:MAG: LamG domain-containing protein, partial [Candidatus Paceibacterota bacterium]
GVLSYGSNQALSPLYNTSGLVGYWNFDEGSGTIAKDTSGNNNNGTLAAGVLWKNGSACQVGSCVDFVPGSVVTVLNAPSLNLPNALTIAGWFDPIATPSGEGATQIFNKWGTTADANYVWYWYSHNSWCPDCNGILATMGGSWGGVTSYANLPIGQWYHLALTYSSTTGANFYINGVLTRQDTYRGLLGTNSINLAIGADVAGFEHRFDDLRLYNRALSTSEIQALYNATK